MTPQIKQRIDQIRRGEVPEGYTKTKEGIIPSDWTIKKMKQWISLEERPVTLQDDEDYELVTVRRAYGGVDSRGIYKGKDVLVKTYFSVAKDDFIISKRQIAHGACGLVTEKLHGAVVSNEYNVFKANEGTNIHFFNLMMQLPHYKRLFYLMSDGVHIEKLLFKTGDWMKRSLAMPPLAEQKKIAEILSAQDKLIALKEKLIEEKKRQKKYLMQQLLTGKKRLPGFSGEWKKMKIGDICLLNPSLGAQIDENESIVFLGMSDVSEEGNIIIQNIKMYKDVKSGFTSFMRGDILIAKITPCFENGKGAKTEKLLTNYGFGSTEFHVLRCKPLIHNLFMFYHTVTDKFRLKLENEMTGSAGQKRVQISSIAQYYIDVPPIEEQAAIVNLLSTIDNEIELLTSSLDQEKQKKKALMQLLLSGVVRVNV